MAGSAGHIRVAIRQQEPGRAVIEFRSQPTVKRMARFASGWKLRADVIWIRGLLEIT